MPRALRSPDDATGDNRNRKVLHCCRHFRSFDRVLFCSRERTLWQFVQIPPLARIRTLISYAVKSENALLAKLGSEGQTTAWDSTFPSPNRISRALGKGSSKQLDGPLSSAEDPTSLCKWRL